MNEFLSSHLYLFSQIISLSLYSAGLAVLFSYRKSILIASIITAPQAFYALFLVPEYWNPPRIMILGVGLEDFLFSFISGGLIWMAVILVMKRNMKFQTTFLPLLRRFFYCLLFGLFFFVILFLAGVKGIWNPFVTMLAWSIFILLYRPGYLRIFLTVSVLSLLIYGVLLKLVFLLWPAVPTMWVSENLSGWFLMEIPVEELIFAFLYGGAYSMALAFFFNLQVPSKKNGFLTKYITVFNVLKKKVADIYLCITYRGFGKKQGLLFAIFVGNKITNHEETRFIYLSDSNGCWCIL